MVGVQPQTPDALHVCGLVQMPQRRVVAQPSESVPHVTLWAAQVVGVHAPTPQTLEVPLPPHVWEPVQVPQLREPPHPSAMMPQVLPWAEQVVGVQPQTLGVPAPPQVSDTQPPG